MKPLPEILVGVRIRQATPFGTLHLFVIEDVGSPIEVFAQIGKAGDLVNADLEGLCRLISVCLRSSVSLDVVIDQLSNIGSSLVIKTADIMSLPDAIAKGLKMYKERKKE